MKTYTSFDRLKRDWYTTDDLFKVLEDAGFAHNLHALLRWEKKGVMPKTKRVIFRGRTWRVYSKDGVDFKEIIRKLNSLSGMKTIRA